MIKAGSKFAVFLSVFLVCPALLASGQESRRERDAVPLRNWIPALPQYAEAGEGEGRIAGMALPSAASHFIAMIPCRVVDTRNPDGAHGGPMLPGGVSRAFNITTGPCSGIPVAAGYSLNIAVTGSVSGSIQFLTAYPAGAVRPLVATMNFDGGETTSNAALVPADAAGAIEIYASTDTHVIIDINGYFAEEVRVPRATGLGPDDTTDSGRILSRTVVVTKRISATALRVTHTDNRRVFGPNKAGRWEIRANGVSCPGGALVYDYYVSESSNNHHSETVVGYCEGLSAGAHEIQVWVGPVPGYTMVDLYTGWFNSRWVLEAEEVP